MIDDERIRLTSPRVPLTELSQVSSLHDKLFPHSPASHQELLPLHEAHLHVQYLIHSSMLQLYMDYYITQQNTIEWSDFHKSRIELLKL